MTKIGYYATEDDREIETDPAALARRPSALIRLTLDDLAAALSSGRYVAHSPLWHTPIVEDVDSTKIGKCAICFAGARWAMTLGRSPEQKLVPSGVLEAGEMPLAIALDCFREGDVGAAFVVLGLSEEAGRKLDRRVYHEIDTPEFVGHMRQLAIDLEAAGF